MTQAELLLEGGWGGELGEEDRAERRESMQSWLGARS